MDAKMTQIDTPQRAASGAQRRAGYHPSVQPLGALMRLAPILILSVALLSAACGEDLVDRATAEAAVDEASIAVQCQLITSSLADIAATTPDGSTAEERAVSLANGTSKLLDCGIVEAHGSTVSLSFGGLGCVIRGQRLWGDVLIDVADMPNQAHLTLSEVTDSGLTISGQSLLNLDVEPRAIEDDATVTLNVTGAPTYAYRDHRKERISTAGVELTEGFRCSTLASTAVSCDLAEDGLPVCSEPEGDCRGVKSAGITLTWNKDVAEAGVHLVGPPNHIQEVELTYGPESCGDEVSGAALTETLVCVKASVSNLVDASGDLETGGSASETPNTFYFKVDFP
jgi:hypothetical protein